ncbi:MAG: YaaC family protein [Acidimicrobiia bacterium]
MGRPPQSRDGIPAASGGRPIVAGVAPFRRSLLPSNRDSELWASLNALAIEPHGYRRLERKHGIKLDVQAGRRFSAYVVQAQQYYATIGTVDPIAKPLSGYYFALNLAKAYLTAVDPNSTTPDFVHHGLTSGFARKSRYFFQQEVVRVRDSGVFRQLAQATGRGFCWAKGYEMRIVDLMPYLPDGYDLYADANDEAPKLLPVADCFALFGGKQGWIRVEVNGHELRQRNIGPESLPTRARIFGEAFRLVSSDLPTFSYESKKAFSYNKKLSEVLADLCTVFDGSLVASNRYVPGNQRYLVLSPRSSLLSHEAVTFAVLHQLSTIVRYRPQDAERVRGTKHFWLFSGWIDRACQGLLLGVASRITREEHVAV